MPKMITEKQAVDYFFELEYQIALLESRNPNINPFVYFGLNAKINESEEKSMLRNVTVKHEENKALEKYWLMRAIKDGDMYGQPPTPKRVISEKELDHEPTADEIAQFLYDSKADFVSVVQNYRFKNELPF